MKWHILWCDINGVNFSYIEQLLLEIEVIGIMFTYKNQIISEIDDTKFIVQIWNTIAQTSIFVQ